MSKKVIRITEGQLKEIIENQIKLKERFEDDLGREVPTDEIIEEIISNIHFLILTRDYPKEELKRIITKEIDVTNKTYL